MSDPGKAVFLSYASQDAEAAKRIADALRTAGVEVWFDAEGGLEHGDEWDAKIRRQIKECVLFLPIISANTQAREEGYFRIEWELAAQRALGIASGVAFILPIVIDDTKEPDALVPDRFRAVQWTRLRDGELTPEVKTRFLKLWSHRTGMVKHAETVGRDLRIPPASDKAGFGDPALQPKPGWKTYAGLAVTIIALVAVVGWWLLRPKPTGPVPPASGLPSPASGLQPPTPPVSVLRSPGSAVPAAPSSEARQLAGKAQAIIDSLDSVRDDYKLAQELVARAKTMDATDAEVCATEAQVHQRYIQRGWDTTDARREMAQVATQRALRLDPQSFEARFAQAGLLAYTGREGEEKERLLLKLRQERPTEKRVLRELGSTISRLGRVEEAIVFMDESAALPGGDPLALYNKSMSYWRTGHTVEAEAALQASLAQQPFTSALLIGAWYAMALHGDLARARTFLERVSPAELREDRGCYISYYLHLLAREPDAALARLRAVPRDWISDNWYRGPKGRLAGDALKMAGRAEAAAVEWRAALKVVDARLATDPTNGNLQYNRILLLAKLGDKPAAEQQFAVLVQLAGIDLSGTAPVPAYVTEICVELGRKADVFRQIPLSLKRERRSMVDYTAAMFRLDPQYDALRADPDFQKLIAEAEAIEKAATIAFAPPRNWPKDPQLKRVIELIEGLESIPDDFALAEQIVKPMVEREPTNLEAVTVMARVQSHYMRRGFDRSDERSALAKLYAERALQLGPEEPEALYALATYLFSRVIDSPRAERLLRRAIELDPTNPRPGRALADLYNATNRPVEAITQGQDNIRRFPKDALSHYDLGRNYKDQGRYEEFDRELDATLAIAPLPNAILWKGRLQFGLHNDLAGMKTWLDRVPERVRGTERGVFTYFLYAGFSGDLKIGLETLRGFPLKWFTDFEYAGPTALLTASLLELEGRKELARQQYEAAFAEIQRMRATDPGRIGLNSVEFWTLLGLGRREEARASHRRMIEGLRRPHEQSLVNGWWFATIPASLLLGERGTALELLQESVATLPESRAAFRLRFQLDPRMAQFRDDPEIVALLAEPEGKKQ